MDPIVVKADSSAHFLRLVPDLVGVVPVESLVLVAFRGNRAGSALRLDLPPHLDEIGLKRFANTAIGMLCRVEGIDGVVPIAYTTASFGQGAIPHSALLQRMATRAKTAGLHVLDVFCVAADGYGSLLDPDLRRGGLPVSDLERPEGLGGRPLSVAAAVALPHVAPAQTLEFRARCAEWFTTTGAAFGRGAISSRVMTLAERQDDMIEVTEALLATSPADAEFIPRAAVAAALLEFAVFRDVVMLQIAWGAEFGRQVYRTTIADGAAPMHPHDPVALAFRGGDMARPDPARIELGIVRLRLAAALADPLDRAPLLAVLSWLHWALGRGSVAGGFADLALAADPGYRFADLMRGLLDTGALPEWAYRQAPISAAGRRWSDRSA